MTRLHHFMMGSLCLLAVLARAATGLAGDIGPETVPAIDKIVAKELEGKKPPRSPLA